MQVPGRCLTLSCIHRYKHGLVAAYQGTYICCFEVLIRTGNFWKKRKEKRNRLGKVRMTFTNQEVTRHPSNPCMSNHLYIYIYYCNLNLASNPCDVSQFLVKLMPTLIQCIYQVRIAMGVTKYSNKYCLIKLFIIEEQHQQT